MDKRTKILLGVLGGLLILGGGFIGYMMMTAEDMAGMETAQVTGEVPEIPAQQPEPEQPAPPAEVKPEPPPAPPAEVKPEPQPAPPAEAKPVPDAQEAAPAEDAKKAEVAKVPEPAKPAPCVTTLKVKVGGKDVEFNTPEDLIEKSGLAPEAIKEFSARNMEAAQKTVEDVKKSRAGREATSCAQTQLDMANRLATLVATMFPEKPEPKIYTYSSLDKRDPFMSPKEIPKVYPKIPASAPPIQQVPSEQLRVKAIIWNEKGYRALVFTPDNRGYTVMVGDIIGNKRGKVDRITDKRIYIKELIPDIFGDIETRNIVLKLYKEAEQS